MALTGMSRFFRWFFAGAFTILLGMLGFERKKNQKKDIVIENQEKQIEQQKKQVQAYAVAQELIVETAIQMEKIKCEQKVEEERIKEASNNVEETIAIANDIVSRFNTRH